MYSLDIGGRVATALPDNGTVCGGRGAISETRPSNVFTVNDPYFSK